MDPLIQLSFPIPLRLRITLSHWELLAALPAISSGQREAAGRRWLGGEGERGLRVAVDDVRARAFHNTTCPSCPQGGSRQVLKAR